MQRISSCVSIIVVTYNSSSFVLETLESVSKQTWKEIELIITDDCSQDDTIDVCRNWIKINSKRFIRVELIKSEKNTGVPANANRGLNNAKGDWIILLAGDDTLKPGCIEDNIKWITSHPEVKVLFSCIDVYNNTFEPHNLIRTIPDGDPYNPNGIMAHGRSSDSQYKMLLLCDRIHFTPSLFLHRETVLSVGGFDERLRMLEDYPMWLKLTKNGYRLSFMDKVTVNYRQHSKAINNTGVDNIINPNYFNQEEFRKIYTYPYLPVDIRLNQRFIFFITLIFRNNLLNKNNTYNRFLLSLLTIYLNPFKYFIYFKKFLNKNLKENDFYK